MPPSKNDAILAGDSLWYKDAIIYEVHIRAFYDSNGDGIGDFQGLTEKLDYLQDLGITAIWLLPFYPSPLRDDGYDIADYNDVNPMYGDLQDVKQFIREAHKRGLRVITELVCNHTSDQHPWFQKARHAKRGSPAREMYVWSDTDEKYQDARIIFTDTERSNWTWDPVAEQYYWHRFFSHQPDLNFDSPAVRKAVLKAMDFWLQMGVDGLRLDAIPYLYEREGTICENLPETHAFLKELRAHIDQKFSGRMLLAEANQWPEDAVAYFGDDDECQMCFHFPVMPRLYMSVRMEDRFPIIDILDQTPAIPPKSQWALFLRNHDELTLEMVTDEERDYMYRVYANDPQARINLGIRRRLAPLLGNNRRKIELMNGLLFALPGTPVLYYGDEIGMGDNIYVGDRNGVRTPMQWSPDRNAGFSKASPQRLYLPVVTEPEYNYETVNVEAQQNNPSSLLWWMKRLIALRKRYQAFGRGTIEFLQPENRKVLAFVRRYENENILVIANMSRFVQAVELDMAEFKGMTPVEMFGRIEFPPIGELPYFITLGPHNFYWFALEPQNMAGMPSYQLGGDINLPEFAVNGTWQSMLAEGQSGKLTNILPAYLKQRRWFRGKARRIRSVQITDTIPLSGNGVDAQIALVEVLYNEGDPETYVLPLAFATGEHADAIIHDTPGSAIARLQPSHEAHGVLYDPSSNTYFATALLQTTAGRRRLRGAKGEVTATTTRVLREAVDGNVNALEPSVSRAEQSNTSVIYGDKLILKVFRNLEEGVNPDLEIGRYLTEQRSFPYTAPLAGALEYRRPGSEPMTLALLQGFVPNEGDAWNYTLDALGRFFERALTTEVPLPEMPPLATRAMIDATEEEIPDLACEMVGTYIEQARLLGERTAEMHLALAEPTDNKQFAPEPFTTMYQRSMYQSMRTLSMQAFQTLRKQLSTLEGEAREEAQQLLGMQSVVMERFRKVIDGKINATRTRYHGDYHLGQVLYTGRDFAIIDFEGEPARRLSERRIKRSPLQDVAGMLRSFRYASHAALLNQAAGATIRPEDMDVAQEWGHYWTFWVSVSFLKQYLATAGNASFIPQKRENLEVLLDAFLLEKAVYELGYELNNRPAWVRIPLQGILQLVEPGEVSA
ncbi:MAG TPA: maltose alpha-D-glucosyltransferase [Roseiflexaceae bacterium]|nr:maltose alpha-D-glucosyltransferase [Roseiflexaceae bacterium]